MPKKSFVSNRIHEWEHAGPIGFRNRTGFDKEPNILQHLRMDLNKSTVRRREKLAHMFKLLSVDTRIRLLELLKDRSYCVGALARKLGVTQAAVSQHLRLLRNADLVIAEKQGYFVHYRVNADTLTQWQQEMHDLLNPSGTDSEPGAPS